MKISTQKQKTDKNAVFGGIGIFSVSLLAAVSTAYIFNPTVGTRAEESQEAEINLTVSSAIAIRTNTDSLNLEANVGDFVHGAINVDVVTNSQYGYTLTLEDSDDNSALVHSNPSISNKVTSEFSGSKTSSTMEDNTWGFSLNATDYYHIPDFGYPVKLKNTNVATAASYDTTVVDFGAKVGLNLTAGTYTDVVKFTAYVNGSDGKPTTNPSDSSATVDTNEPGVVVANPCKNAPYVSGGVLTDPRDGKTYTVTAGKDGHCWMTQNLALMNAELTSANSNIPEGETFTIPESSKSNFEQGSTIPAAYMQEEPGYGGLYSFYTATAGWGTTDVITGNSPKDICPKGWRLPTGGDDGEFKKLMNDYYPGSFYSDPAPFANELGFILSGSIDYGVLSAQGYRGFYWTSSSEKANKAYFFYIASNMINPSISFDKYYGYALRCMSK